MEIHYIKQIQEDTLITDGWMYHSLVLVLVQARKSFGALRVLNDDTIAAGMGFNIHTTIWKLSPFRLKEI
jgi:hypothetical protein